MFFFTLLLFFSIFTDLIDKNSLDFCFTRERSISQLIESVKIVIGYEVWFSFANSFDKATKCSMLILH